MVLEFLSFKYFLVQLVFILITLGFYLFLRNKEYKFKYYTVLVISIFALLFHFLKLLHPYYSKNLPYSIRTVTADNVCALNTLLMPFFILTKNKKFKDYFVLLGGIGGLVVFVYPFGSINVEVEKFELFRYIFSHYLLFLVSFLMLALRIHYLDIRRVFYYPLILIFFQVMILFNEIVLISYKLVETDMAGFFNKDSRNQSYFLGFQTKYKFLNDYFASLVPDFLYYNPYTNSLSNLPVVWMIIPAFLLLPIQFFIYYMIFPKRFDMEGYYVY